MVYDGIAELMVAAPGRRAPMSALQTLRQLADDGDFDALLALCAVIAQELGHDPRTAGLRAATSLDELAGAQEVPPLLRLYALGVLPRAILGDLHGWQQLARELDADAELAAFQALVRRRGVVADEVLRAFVVAGFVRLYGMEYIEVSPGAQLATLEQILSDTRIVPGHGADATFEFGRAFLLSRPTGEALMFTIIHELGHHVLESARTAPSTVEEDMTALARALGEALPRLVSAAYALGGQQMHPGDPRWWRSAGAVSVHCTWQERPGGAYAHVSLSDHDGPIALSKACVLALFVVRALGTDPVLAVAAYSPRGVFHLGVAGKPAPADGLAEHAAASAAPGAEEEAGAWFASLDAAGRVGRNESDIRYLLGVDSRPVTVYAPDPETWEDLERCRQLDEGAKLSGATPEQLEDLVRLATRVGNPSVLTRVLAAASAASTELGNGGIPDLGRCCCVVRDSAGTTHIGAHAQHLLACLGVLHAAGADLGGPVTEDGETLLTDAAARGEPLVAALLAAGVPADGANAGGETPLAIAAAYGARGAAARLLDAGAAVAARDGVGHTPLHRAAAAGAAEVCALLLARGAGVDARSALGETPLMKALSGAVVELLTAAGADVDAAASSGQTALIAAALGGRVEVVRALLAAGADPEAATDLGQVALHGALHAPQDDDAEAMVAALVAAGAEVDEEADDGMTPLMVAARVVRPALVAALLSHGADPLRRTVTGNTALILASDGREEWDRDPSHNDRMAQCLRILVAGGADVNAANEAGETPLIWATRGFDVGPVEVLLELGADPNGRAADGATALGQARAQNHEKMVEELRVAGAREPGPAT